MVIIHDTRDQNGKHKNVERYLIEHGHEIVRSKMYVGDISKLTDQSVCIDLKGMGLQEVYSNLVQQHERFKAECIRAQNASIRLIILVEEDGITDLDGVTTWDNPRIRQYADLVMAHSRGKRLSKKLPSRPPISSQRLCNMMRVMSARYGVEWQFCRKEDAGKRVVEILQGGGGLG